MEARQLFRSVNAACGFETARMVHKTAKMMQKNREGNDPSLRFMQNVVTKCGPRVAKVRYLRESEQTTAPRT